MQKLKTEIYVLEFFLWHHNNWMFMIYIVQNTMKEKKALILIFSPQNIVECDYLLPCVEKPPQNVTACKNLKSSIIN